MNSFARYLRIETHVCHENGQLALNSARLYTLVADESINIYGLQKDTEYDIKVRAMSWQQGNDLDEQVTISAGQGKFYLIHPFWIHRLRQVGIGHHLDGPPPH